MSWLLLYEYFQFCLCLMVDLKSPSTIIQRRTSTSQSCPVFDVHHFTETCVAVVGLSQIWYNYFYNKSVMKEFSY